MAIVRKYFPALSSEPCALCGSNWMQNRPPGYWFATAEGQFVCHACCSRHGRKAWREEGRAQAKERRRQEAENREEGEEDEEEAAAHEC